jgi:hypothetical protein
MMMGRMYEVCHEIRRKFHKTSSGKLDENMNQKISVCIGTGCRLDSRCSIPGRGKKFVSTFAAFKPVPGLTYMGYFPRVEAAGA